MMNIYTILEKLNIKYVEIEHKAVFTVEEALKEDIPNKIEGIECKNLFVTGKNKFYLIFLEASKRANLKELAGMVNETRLSFASEKQLKEILGLEAGSVTPLGIVNDKNNEVILLIDKSLKGKKVLVHPNVNTRTISLELDDLLKVIEFLKRDFTFV